MGNPKGRGSGRERVNCACSSFILALLRTKLHFGLLQLFQSLIQPMMSVYTPMMHCCLAFVLNRVQILFATPKSNEEVINDQALRRIQRDIDLAEARLQRP